MKGILCPLHDEVEGKEAPRLKVPKEYTPLVVEGRKEDTKYMFSEWNYSSFTYIDRRQTAVFIPFENTP